MTRDRLDQMTHFLWLGLHWLGIIMITVGMSLFLTHFLETKIGRNGPMRMDTPCAIFGQTQLYVAGEKLYLFCEQESAVNVYDLDGTFLFRVQGPRLPNGRGSLALWGEEIYLTSRTPHRLIRFDKDGNCLGWAEDGWVYDREGKRTAFQYTGTPLYFDEEKVCYNTWMEKEKTHAYYYIGVSGTHRLRLETDAEVIGWLGGSYAEYGKTVTYGDVVYGVSLNKLYKIENGQKEILAKTPLVQWYLRSNVLEWLSAVAGAAIMHLAGKRVYYLDADIARQKKRPIGLGRLRHRKARS